MNQICTTIKQSKKLLKLGLNPNTSDMYWRDWKRMTKDISISHVGKASKEDLPAWSLSAMIYLLPRKIKYNNIECLRFLDLDRIQYLGAYYHGGYNLCAFSTCSSDVPFIDHVYKTIVWLLENNYIKTNKVKTDES